MLWPYCHPIHSYHTLLTDTANMPFDLSDSLNAPVHYSSAYLAVDKDQDLALLVPFSQHLKETREALLLRPYLNNLIDIGVDNAPASNL